MNFLLFLLQKFFKKQQDSTETPIAPKAVKYMITRSEMNPGKYALTEEQEQNQIILHERINKVRQAFGKPMVVSSGVRSMEDQLRINPNAPKSKHLIGAAIDIADPKRELAAWCLSNMDKLEEFCLWIEDLSATDNGPRSWVHFQSIPPRSGKRMFVP